MIKVESVVYEKNSDMPVWAVEDPGPLWDSKDIQLIWGIVDENTCKAPQSIATMQQEALYIPSSATYASSGFGYGDSLVSLRFRNRAQHQSHHNILGHVSSFQCSAQDRVFGGPEPA